MDLATGGITAALVTAIVALTEVIKFFLVRNKTTDLHQKLDELLSFQKNINRRVESLLEEAKASMHKGELLDLKQEGWRKEQARDLDDIATTIEACHVLLQNQDRIIERVGELANAIKKGE